MNFLLCQYIFNDTIYIFFQKANAYLSVKFPPMTVSLTQRRQNFPNEKNVETTKSRVFLNYKSDVKGKLGKKTSDKIIL